MAIDVPEPIQPVSFKLPPVKEVAFAIQTTEPVFGIEECGAIASELRADFPARQQLPALPPLEEEFGIVPQGPRIIFQPEPPAPRLWFLSEDSSRLVQVQSDRFAFNWRELDSGEAYPRYASLRSQFVDLAERAFDAAAGVDAAATSASMNGINAVELSYVNELSVPEGAPPGVHPQFSRFVRRVQPMAEFEFLPESEDLRFQARWRIPDENGAPIGRLYASAEPAFKVGNEEPIYLMTMVARLMVPGSGLADAIKAIDNGHEWIVRGFKDLTTDEMHRQWGLES